MIGSDNLSLFGLPRPSTRVVPSILTMSPRPRLYGPCPRPVPFGDGAFGLSADVTLLLASPCDAYAASRLS